MRNTAKRFLALLLAVCLLAALGVPALAAGEDGFDYVALGASMTNGYGMRYYLDPDLYNFPNKLSMDGPGASGYRNHVAGSYPYLVGAALQSRVNKEVTVHQLAQSSMRVEELRYLLDDSFSGDEYTRWRFYDPSDDSGFWGNGNLDAIKQDYRESIRNAEFITYDMGVNNFGVYISNQLQSNLFGADFANIVGEKYASRFYALRSQIHAAAAGILGSASTLETVESILDTLTYALLGFEVNFDATMKIIRQLNPDCDIVTVAIQNPMAGMDVSLKGLIIPFGELYAIMCDMANAYMVTLSPYAKEYYFADVRQNGRVTFFFDELMQYNGDPHTLSQDMLDCFNAYDRKLHANQSVKLAMQAAGLIDGGVDVDNNLPYEGEYAELYNTVLYKVYDATARILKIAGSIDAAPLDGVLAGEDMGRAGDELMDRQTGMPGVLRQYAESLVKEEMKALSPANQLLTAEPLPLVLPEESVINASEVLTAAEEPVQEIVEEASAAPEQIDEAAGQIEETVLEEAVSELPVMDEQSPAEIVSAVLEAPVPQGIEETLSEMIPAAEPTEQAAENVSVQSVPEENSAQMPVFLFEDAINIAETTVEEDLAFEQNVVDILTSGVMEEPAEDVFDLDAAIAELLSSDSRKLAAAIGMRTSIGNTFFTHPNAQGHQELTAAVLRAYDQQISSRRALAEAIKGLESKALSLSVKYGPRVLVLIAEKICDVLTPDESIAETIKEIIPSGKDLSESLAKVLKLLNIKDFGDFSRVSRLKNAMDELEKYLKKNPDALHDHVPVYCAKDSASCTKDGHIGCWRCVDCGELFEDYGCTRPLTSEETVIPAVGHSMKKVAAKEATVLSTGNIEYYICTRCGLWYYDQEGTKLITNPLAVVTPKRSLLKAILK